MTRARTVLAAAAICLYMTVSLWMARTGGSSVHAVDLVASLTVVLLCIGLGWALASRVTRDPDRRGIIALVVGTWGIAFGTFHILAATHLIPVLQRTWLAALAWTMLCVLLILLIARGRNPVRFAARALVIAAVVLLGVQGWTAAPRLLAAESATRVHGAARERTIPDVYVIVLDKYSSGSWLRQSYDLDQRPFEDSLRRLGFAVPPAARANYAHTQISLASLLNWSYMGGGADHSTELDWDSMRRLIANARAWSVFRTRGYRIVAFPTTFPATRSFPNVDVELRPPATRASRLPVTWWSNSPLTFVTQIKCGRRPCLPRAIDRAVTPYPVEDLTALRWKLRTVATLPDSAGPVFAFVHLLVPHEPYLFDSDCSEREPWWPLSDQGDDFASIGRAYADQVRCLAPLLLQTVRELVERSTVPPVIILQSDHGHGRIAVDPLRGFTLASDELPAEQLGDRLAVFAAYRFPGADTLVADDISPVNVLPLVMRSLFAAGPELQPDRSYWSSYQSAFSFTEVAPETIHPR